MSTTALEIWEKIQRLSMEEQEELRKRLMGGAAGWPEPAPPSAFEGIDSPEEIAEQNALAKACFAYVPGELE